MKSAVTWGAILFGALIPAAAIAEQPEGYAFGLLDADEAPAYTAAEGVCRREGILVLPEGDSWVRTHHHHKDFVLEFQWRPPADQPGAGSLRVGIQDPEANQPAADRIDLPGPSPPTDAGGDPPVRATRPGEWNDVRLRIADGEARLEINEVVVWEKDLAVRPGQVEIRSGPPGSGPLELRDLQVVELGHRSLFNGRDLDGWEGIGGDVAQSWAVRDGVLLCTGVRGAWLRTAEPFDDFNVRLEYKLTEAGNSGVYIRVARGGGHHGDNAGIEVQILDDAAERYSNLKPYQYSASLYAIAPAEARVSRPAGEWNTLEIDCFGTAYRVIHNGCEVVRATPAEFPELARRRLEGYLGLQNHRDEVHFRHLRIGPSLAAGHVPQRDAP